MSELVDHVQSLKLAERYLELGLYAAADALLSRVSRIKEGSDVTAGSVAEIRAQVANRRGRPMVAREQAQIALQRGESAGRWALFAESALACSDDEAAERGFVNAQLVAERGGEGVPVEARLGQAAVAHRRRDGAAVLVELQGILATGEGRRIEVAEALCDLAHSAQLVREVLATALVENNSLVVALLKERLGEPTNVEALLAEEGGVASRLALALRLARRRSRDPSARRCVVEMLARLLEDMVEEGRAASEIARVHLLLATIYDDDPEGATLAEEHYKAALANLPREVMCCNNLAVIAMARGQLPEAQKWLLRALVADPRHETSYTNLARALIVQGEPGVMREILAELAELGTDASAAANLCYALVEVARHDARHDLASKGHQLKNLLGVVGARLRSAVKRSEGEMQERLDRVASRLAGLYDEWAAYLRTMREERGVLDTFAPNALASEAAREMEGRVDLRLGDRLPDLIGLRPQLREALVNLLRNALEAQTSGSVQLRTRELDQGAAVEFSVADHGAGIPTRHLRQVRAVGFTTKSDGSGFGLSLAERIVRAHGGRLEIRSEEGVGTTARLVLPVQLDSQMRHGMLGAGLGRILRSATAEEVVAEE
ncbi:MAG: HAMP domain-containing histidine kinase [Deltaproteobacteria bacterium]|nr:HAMP domain-containing histidine kinase [Deltaproteobacteria bacterium]